MVNDFMLEVQSEVIQAVHWNPDNLELRIRFHNDGLYLYRDVGPSDLADFLFNGSIGRAFLDHIKGKFDYERLE